MDATPDRSWSDLAQLDASARQQQMTAVCREVAELPDDQRLERLEAMVRAEYELGEDLLRPFTLTRLKTWIEIDSDNPELAQRLARGYDAVFDKLPGAMAMRRASVVQNVARTDLSLEEVDSLFRLVPSLVRQVPRAHKESATEAKGKAYSAAQRVKAEGGGRPWWKFWERAQRGA
jgi:hypothetical protein